MEPNIEEVAGQVERCEGLDITMQEMADDGRSMAGTPHEVGGGICRSRSLQVRVWASTSSGF